MSGPAVVRCDDEGVVASGPDGTELAIRWRDVRRIEIVTNGDGPWEEDVWWVLAGDAARCAWPIGADGADDALAELQARFPGFDNGAVVAAMGCVEEARFLCWEGPPAS